LKPILLDGYLGYLSNATGLNAKRVIFLAWLVLQYTTRSDFRDFQNLLCAVFLSETNFG
jgi:hypothetical protein